MAQHNPDTDDDELASPVRNHGKVNPARLSPNTRAALIYLAQVLRDEPGLLRVQVTFDDLHGDLSGHDEPPTIHAILAPDGNPDYWLGGQS